MWQGGAVIGAWCVVCSFVLSLFLSQSLSLPLTLLSLDLTLSAHTPTRDHLYSLPSSAVSAPAWARYPSTCHSQTPSNTTSKTPARHDTVCHSQMPSNTTSKTPASHGDVCRTQPSTDRLQLGCAHVNRQAHVGDSADQHEACQ